MLRADKLDLIKASVQDLVEDLSRHADRAPEQPERKGNADVPTIAEQQLPRARAVPAHLEPEELRPEWRSPGAVLCIAGRGPLDAAAATILAQLLGKHGLGARVIEHEAASRRGIDSLDLDGVAMVCVAYLQVKGSPSHLRYLIQRLRLRLPRQKLTVGLWPSDDPLLADAAQRRELGADLFISSLHDAVEACLAEARGDVAQPVAA